jgi:hypothetical protein
MAIITLAPTIQTVRRRALVLHLVRALLRHRAGRRLPRARARAPLAEEAEAAHRRGVGDHGQPASRKVRAM